MKDHLFFAAYWAAWAVLLYFVFIQQSAPAMNILQFVVGAVALACLALMLQIDEAVRDRAKRPLSPHWRVVLGWVFAAGVLVALVWHGHMVLGALYGFQMWIMSAAQMRLNEYVKQAAKNEEAAPLTASAPR